MKTKRIKTKCPACGGVATAKETVCFPGTILEKRETGRIICRDCGEVDTADQSGFYGVAS